MLPPIATTEAEEEVIEGFILLRIENASSPNALPLVYGKGRCHGIRVLVPPECVRAAQQLVAGMSLVVGNSHWYNVCPLPAATFD